MKMNKRVDAYLYLQVIILFAGLGSEPPRDCRRLNFLREYDNENTKLYP